MNDLSPPRAWECVHTYFLPLYLACPAALLINYIQFWHLFLVPWPELRAPLPAPALAPFQCLCCGVIFSLHIFPGSYLNPQDCSPELPQPLSIKSYFFSPLTPQQLQCVTPEELKVSEPSFPQLCWPEGSFGSPELHGHEPAPHGHSEKCAAQGNAAPQGNQLAWLQQCHRRGGDFLSTTPQLVRRWCHRSRSSGCPCLLPA